MTKILLVEDDKSLREIYGVRLLAEGYDIISAGDGEEALALAIKDRPSLIVSDVMMPKISGFDMLDILRSTTETRDIKVIMMTALSSEDQRLRGQQLGADRYLVKSQVGIEDVVRTVHEVLADAPTSSTDFSSPAPAAPAPQPQPSTPAPGPFAPQEPVAPLPEPTAPFSTPRPANPSNRVIEPISNDPSSDAPLADMMAKELDTTEPLVQTPQATPVQEATSSQITQPAQAQEDHGLSFEETPAPTAPNSSPFQAPPTA